MAVVSNTSDPLSFPSLLRESSDLSTPRTFLVTPCFSRKKNAKGQDL